MKVDRKMREKEGGYILTPLSQIKVSDSGVRVT